MERRGGGWVVRSWAVFNDQVPLPAVGAGLAKGKGGSGGGLEYGVAVVGQGGWWVQQGHGRVGAQVVVGQREGWGEGGVDVNNSCIDRTSANLPFPFVFAPECCFLGDSQSAVFTIAGCGNTWRQDGVPVQQARPEGACQLPGGPDCTAFLDRGLPTAPAWRYCLKAFIIIVINREGTEPVPCLQQVLIYSI